MEELIEDCVLDDLFETRTDGFQGVFLKENGKAEEIEEVEQVENELDNMIKELIQDEKIQEQILEKLEQFTDSKIGESCFGIRNIINLELKMD